MQLGLVFPTSEIGNDPVAIRDFAQAAEDLGYSRLVVFDHVLATPHGGRSPELQGPYTELDPFHEAFVLLAFLAGVTSTIEFMTGVMVLPQRQTVLIAKQAAELSILSGGRFGLGVGTGWNFVEYEAMGVDFARRGAILSEQVGVLRALWTQPIVDFSGEFHRIDRGGLLPRPQLEIPIWFGGWAPVSLRRAAMIGDGYISGAAGYEHVEQLLQMLDAAGRDRATFGMGQMLSYDAGHAAWEQALTDWAALGGTDLWVSTQAPGRGIRGDAPVAFDTVDGHLRAIEEFMRVAG